MGHAWGPAANVIVAVAVDALILDNHISAVGVAGVRIEDGPAANEQLRARTAASAVGRSRGAIGRVAASKESRPLDAPKPLAPAGSVCRPKSPAAHWLTQRMPVGIRSILLDDGRRVPFDRIAITTGARARQLARRVARERWRA